MGTIGGNLAGGDPLTDPGASLIALDAEVTLSSSKGQRRLPLDEFFIDYYQTAIEPGELLTEIHVPPPQRPGWSHIKFTRAALKTSRRSESRLHYKSRTVPAKTYAWVSIPSRQP